MPTINRAARRQRLLEDRGDRLALITGRIPQLPSLPHPQSRLSPRIAPNFSAQSPPSVSCNRHPESGLSRRPTDKLVEEATRPNQNGGSRKESILHRHEPGSISGAEQVITTPLSFFSPISSQQLSSALAATAQPRMTFSIQMALLVLMSHFGFLFFSNKIIRSIILFRPLLFLLLSNVASIVTRLAPDMKRGVKDGHKLYISEDYGWVEEAGRALEVGLMLYSTLRTLFMDFIVYSSIIICGFCLAS